MTSFDYHKYSDIDEQAACLAGYDQQYQQLSNGHFNGSFLTCEIDRELILFFESTNQVLYQKACVPDDFYAIGMLIDTDEPIRFKSREFGQKAAFISPSNSAMEGTTSQNMKFCVIHIAKKLLDDLFQQQYFEKSYVKTDGLPYKLFENKEHTLELNTLLNDFLSGVNSNDILMQSSSQINSIKDTFVNTIGSMYINSISAEANSSDITGAKHHQIFHDAIELMNNRLCQEITISNLCTELSVSRRTLEYIFQENISMSPAKYIKILRLNNIRRDILMYDGEKSAKLGDIAAKWGIWHLGRFSKDYAQLFGELPSTTKSSGY